MSSKITYSQLDFIQPQKYPKSFGWLTEAGVFFGELNQIADSPNFITSKKTLAYPEQPNDYRTASYVSRNQNQVPSSFALTEFHLLLQYSDHVTGISLINHEVIYDEYYAEQYGKLMSIVKDPKSGNVYTFSNKTIFRYKINNEKRNVWQMYLEKNEFELAKKYSRDNPAHHDIVLSRIGENLYEKKLYMESAKVFSQTKRSFEEVTLKFLQVNENLPLIFYLKSRLNECDPLTDQMQVNNAWNCVGIFWDFPRISLKFPEFTKILCIFIRIFWIFPRILRFFRGFLGIPNDFLVFKNFL